MTTIETTSVENKTEKPEKRTVSWEEATQTIEETLEKTQKLKDCLN